MHKGLHKVLAVKQVSPHTFTLTIERKGMGFTAGQCVNIGIPETGTNREYSSYSGENDENLEFLIREVEGGQVTPKLKNLAAGDHVEVDGAYGLFTLNPDKPKDTEYVFVATGTGIAPFHCFAKSYPWLKYKIIHGVQNVTECYGQDDYLEYISCTSRDHSGDYSGRVTGYLKDNPQKKDAVYYLCGNRNMINDVYDILREQNVSGSNIITEVFF